MKKKVYVEFDHAIESLLESIGIKTVYDPTEADCIFLSGGSDISPYLYGEKNTASSCNPQRDVFCLSLWRLFNADKKFAGICRGAQFLSAMLGGKLCQHMSRHGEGGYMHEVRGDDFPVNSCHHQGILPHDGIKILHSGPSSTGFIGEEYSEFNPVESFEANGVFAVQWHPEFLFAESHKNMKCVDWFLIKMKEFLK